MVPGDLLIRVVAAAFVIAAAAVVVYALVRTEPEQQPGVRVAEVADGDTLRLANGDVVRLVQIDAPERGDGECYATESRRSLASLVRGQNVRLVVDPAVHVADEDKADRFGRLLRYVFVGELNVNVELVRRGAAAPWFFAGVRGRYATALVDAALAARERDVGLWHACPDARLDPLAPLDTG